MQDNRDQIKIDRRLIERLLNGERSAFDELADQYFDPVYRFASRRIGHDPELAAEMVQNTMVAALKKLDGFRGEATLQTWLCGICHFEIMSHFRRKGRGEEVELEDDQVQAHGAFWQALPEAPWEEMERQERGEFVHRTLDEIAPRYAQVLEWKYLEEEPVAEIASRLGVGLKAAESVLTRARAAYRKAFERLSQSNAEWRRPTLAMPSGASGHFREKT
ncbi:MAG: sigma-70 family RNA polymerase sigma factor [Deltaproteobacteria bacterium]|nr:sigma-70 family RNA polymerase sigma factor [Deltaproteobacteria bacterium]